nr:helix-turn-helix domain-containing protein [Raineyella fluvialis]
MSEAAAHIGGGINPRTVREWISAGILPAYRVGPRFIRVDLNDVDALAERIPTAGQWEQR